LLTGFQSASYCYNRRQTSRIRSVDSWPTIVNLQGSGSHSVDGVNAPPTFSAVNDYSDGSYGDDKVSRIRFKM